MRGSHSYHFDLQYPINH